MCEDNCVLLINPNVQSATNGVLTLQDNDDSALQLTATNAVGVSNTATAFETDGDQLTGKIPVTITEQGPNSGVFGTYDESDTSSLIITTNAARGTSASIDYNESPVTVLVGFDFASIDIQPVDDEWSSGEEIPVVVVDGDQNKNSRADEDLDLDNPNVSLIPALSTGDPFTLGEADSSLRVVLLNGSGATVGVETGGAIGAGFDVGDLLTIQLGASNNGTATLTVQPFSERGILDSVNPVGSTDRYAAYTSLDAIVIDLEATTEDPEEHTSELQSHHDLVCRLLLEKKKKKKITKKTKKKKKYRDTKSTSHLMPFIQS